MYYAYTCIIIYIYIYVSNVHPGRVLSRRLSSKKDNCLSDSLH